MRVLVTGGSGYIGSHTVGALLARGDTVIVVDDLVTGHASRISEVPIVHADLASEASVPVLAQAFIDNQIDAVIHFAARKQVGESVERPAWYYQQNVGGLANLLIAMEKAGVKKLVFSSSAAVYGQADGAITEAHPTVPINPYGQTKLVGEQLITASTAAWGLSAASLRYFNVAGAGNAELADTQALNLVPIVFEAIDAGRPPVIYGGDYDTVDGTCVRDYVHVVDVAEAHLATLDWLDGTPRNSAMNIGTGVGTSVKQMIDQIAAVSGIHIVPELSERRPGDAAAVVAVVDQIHFATGWKARYGLAQIVRSAWQARQESRGN
jgi:UDP-glucose 4-epimerase